MRINTHALFVMLVAIISIPASAFAQEEMRSPEKFEMKIDTSNNIISYDNIHYQHAITMEERQGRGIITSFLITKGVAGIQSLINNHRKKFTADYSFAIKDESFYDAVSTEGAFDPTGMRFKGFTVARILRGEGSRDTAFIAKFVVDTTGDKINEILNNGVFRLRLDTFILKSAKVKMPSHDRTLNMDFEISIVSSFISNTGQINTDSQIGKFIYSIRNAPVDKSDPEYASYYEKLARRKPECVGQSFLVPRSAGYFKNDVTKKIDPCWGQGLFSIKVSVKECSKNTFIDKVIILTSGDLLNVSNSSLQKKYGTPPASSKTTSTAAKKN